MRNLFLLSGVCFVLRNAVLAPFDVTLSFHQREVLRDKGTQSSVASVSVPAAPQRHHSQVKPDPREY